MSVPRFEHGSRVPGWDEAVDLEKDPALIPDEASTPVPAALRAEIDLNISTDSRGRPELHDGIAEIRS